MTCGWTKAQPDMTQYQVMRVMVYMGWNYVRVGNLSDIRCPKSPEFKDIINLLKGPDPERLHSIFSQKRKGEREQMLQIKPDVPIVLAWGKGVWLAEIAAFGLRFLPADNLRGVPSGESKLLFLHASPTRQDQKDRWLRGILEALRA